ncbi:Beta-1-2-xylosyltransferase 1 [Apiospora arundinis]|uniref:Glycosyltransferase family 90 protein n=1 Tax=Apiospora arundinis TaxID=335852 RepID=A0ABR2HR11_9PEZI
MAVDERSTYSSRLTAVCVLVSFFWLSYSVDKHSLIDRPRLSAFLLLLISGALAFTASFFSKRLPGNDGRFDSEAPFKTFRSSLPQRPRRFYLPCIILLIIIRLEILQEVVYDFQCTAQGVEVFLPVFLAGYELLFGKRAPLPVSDEPEDPWITIREEFTQWVKTSQLWLFSSVLVFTIGVYQSAGMAYESSYFCSPVLDEARWIIFLQWAGVLLDATILIMSWRVFAWAKTTKSRLRILSAILAISCLGTGVLWVGNHVVQQGSVVDRQAVRYVDSLYMFDILSTGLVLGMLLVAATLWICESVPLEPVSIIAYIGGTFTTVRQVFLVGTYQQTSAGPPLVALFTITGGFSIFAYANNMRSVVYIRRGFLVLLMLCLVVGAIITSAIRNRAVQHHPVDEFIYKNRVESDRWLRHATVSTTLRTAVEEYKERHNGRDPPAHFDRWFDFSRLRNSAIVDMFDQMEKDILPFWGLSPQKVRDAVEKAKGLPDIGVVTIIRGKASHNEPADPSHQLILDDVVSIISQFSEHLPEMTIPINLNERPRVLVPHSDIRRLMQSATAPKSKFLPAMVNKRDTGESKTVQDQTTSNIEVRAESETGPYVSAEDFHHLQSLACPPGSKTRSGVSWNARDLCATCANPHAQGVFVRSWRKALDPCHQPDIFHLHDFYTMPHRTGLHQDLLPIFSRSKTDIFNDIVIPLLRPDVKHEQETTTFDNKANVLFWQDEPLTETMTHQSFHGGQRSRLVYLTNNASAADEGPLLIGDNYGKELKFAYETVKTSEANDLFTFKTSFKAPEKCEDQTCRLAQAQFGFPATPSTDPEEKPDVAVDHRYVMLLDTPDGPPPTFLAALRSNGVPFVSSIFREWYTERLMPWTHFVPVDLRFHGLHSTLAYFVGLKDRGRVNGRERDAMEARTEDARWIAEQGRKWAEKAIRREDMEIYLFRLLLEWGRLIQDDRDTLGFVLKQE